MDRRWNWFYLLPLALAPVFYFVTQQLWTAWLGLGIGMLMMYMFRPLALPKHLHAAVRHYQRGDLETALELANQSIALVDTRWESFHTRSLINFGLTRLNAAESDARAVVALKPEFYVGHAALGQALYAQAKYAEAADAYEEAVRADPKDAPSRFYLALTHYRLNDHERVATLMPEALALGIENQSLSLLGNYIMGVSLAESGRDDAATEAFELMESFVDGLESLQADLDSVEPYPALAALKADVAAIEQRIDVRA